MKSPVKLNSLSSKFFVISLSLLYHLIGRDSGRLANKAFTSNPIVSSKQWLSSLEVTNWFSKWLFQQVKFLKRGVSVAILKYSFIYIFGKGNYKMSHTGEKIGGCSSSSRSFTCLIYDWKKACSLRSRWRGMWTVSNTEHRYDSIWITIIIFMGLYL